MALFAPECELLPPVRSRDLRSPGAQLSYNHRDVSLRIPCPAMTTGGSGTVAGADANPTWSPPRYWRACTTGLPRCDPGPMAAGAPTCPRRYKACPRTGRRRWQIRPIHLLPRYLGAAYCSAFGSMRRAECEAFRACIPNLDYEWYLRCIAAQQFDHKFNNLWDHIENCMIV